MSSTAGTIKQIISLGAGSDTRFFRIRHKFPSAKLRYHELDFPANTARKVKRLLKPGFINAVKQKCGLDFLSFAGSMSPKTAKVSTFAEDDGTGYFIHPIGSARSEARSAAQF